MCCGRGLNIFVRKNSFFSRLFLHANHKFLLNHFWWFSFSESRRMRRVTENRLRKSIFFFVRCYWRRNTLGECSSNGNFLWNEILLCKSTPLYTKMKLNSEVPADVHKRFPFFASISQWSAENEIRLHFCAKRFHLSENSTKYEFRWCDTHTQRRWNTHTDTVNTVLTSKI